MPSSPQETIVPPAPLALPLPRFRQPIQDDPLPEVTGDPVPATAPSPEATGPQQPSNPEASPAAPPPPIAAPARRTGISFTGDPKLAGEVIAGLIAIGCLWAYTMLGRRGLAFRQPTEKQVDDIAHPLGRIAARHLPTDIIGPDLVDATRAAGAAHHYVIAGPLVRRRNQEMPEDDEQ